MEIDPSIVGYALRQACHSHLLLGRYDEAIESCEKSAAQDETWLVHVYLTAAYTQKGDVVRAAAAKSRLLLRKPGLTMARLKELRHSDHPLYREQFESHIAAGLRKAGLPER